MRRALAVLLAAASPAAAMLPACKPDRMRELQAQDRVIVVFFTSQTCTLCRQQEETLERLARDSGDLSQPAYLQADFDGDDGLRQLWHVSSPSTLVVFRGADLIGQNTGLVSEDDIRAFVRDAVVHSRGRPRGRTPRTSRPKR